jgi:hypothetical protein
MSRRRSHISDIDGITDFSDFPEDKNTEEDNVPDRWSIDWMEEDEEIDLEVQLREEEKHLAKKSGQHKKECSTCKIIWHRAGESLEFVQTTELKDA